MSKLTISPSEEAERRIDAWVLATNVEPLEADWVSLKFELKRLRRLERELAATCEERDRYKADSEALDWCIKKFNHVLVGGDEKGIYTGYSIKLYEGEKLHEHLRKRLEGKK